MLKFVFDLDGTLTKKETLPLIASHFGQLDKIKELTRQAVSGDVPFIESFISRVTILRDFPVSEINALLATIPIYEKLADFIKAHPDNCHIATGNLYCWVEGLLKRFQCHSFCSDAIVNNNKVLKISSIINKKKTVLSLKEQGHKVVFIGDSNNDMEAMRKADISIIAGMTTSPPPSSLQTIGDYLILEENTLCHFLEQLFLTAQA